MAQKRGTMAKAKKKTPRKKPKPKAEPQRPIQVNLPEPGRITGIATLGNNMCVMTASGELWLASQLQNANQFQWNILPVPTAQDRLRQR